jgi:RNA polymerase sigma factor (TIGR02999 family)
VTDAASPISRRVTRILRDWREGDPEAVAALMPLVYDELHRLAAARMRRERSDHTLQPTALVHEAFTRLVDADVPWRDRGHFFSVAARTMRRVLVDHARARGRDKRGGAVIRVSLEAAREDPAAPAAGIEVLDDALAALTAFDERKARIVELHYFAGLTRAEIAQALRLSPSTVDLDLRLARAWLRRQLERATAGSLPTTP